MKINELYNRHATRLAQAAAQGRPFAALFYTDDNTFTACRSFAEQKEASRYLKEMSSSFGYSGVVAETGTDGKGCKAFYIPPVTGYRPFA